MDAADVLYGVSMGKGGVTKVVSRKLRASRAARARGEAAEARLSSLPLRDGVGGADPERGRAAADAEAASREPRAAQGRFARLRERLSKSRQALRAELSASLFDQHRRARPGSGSRRR